MLRLLTRVIDHVERMVIGAVMLDYGVIQALVDCRDDCITAQITVIFITRVPEITLKEEHIAWLHLNRDEFKPLKGSF